MNKKEKTISFCAGNDNYHHARIVPLGNNASITMLIMPLENNASITMMVVPLGSDPF